MNIKDFKPFEEVYINLKGTLIKSTVVSIYDEDVLVTLCTFGDLPDGIKMLPYCFFNANLVCLNKGGAVLLKKDKTMDCCFAIQQLSSNFQENMKRVNKNIEELYGLTLEGLPPTSPDYKYGNIKMDRVKDLYTDFANHMDAVLKELSIKFGKSLKALEEQRKDIVDVFNANINNKSSERGNVK